MQLIDHYPDGWIPRTCEWFDELSASMPECHLYLLMDAAFRRDEVLPYLRAHVPADHWHALYADAPNASDRVLAVSPVLVSLTEYGRDFLGPLLELTSGMPMLSLIATPEAQDVLLQRLGAFRVVTVQEGRFVLRLADTRRLPQIIGMLDAQQHGALMGPAMAWYYVDRDTSWQSLPLPGCATEPMPGVTFSGQQTQALVEMNGIDAFIDTIRREETWLYDAFDLPSRRYRWIVSALADSPEPAKGYAERLRCCRLAASERGLRD